MIVLWIMLLVLHQGYTLIPVIPVQTGESTTFICARSNTDLDRGEIHWYKQSVGDNLKLIVTLLRSAPQFAPEFPTSRWKVNSDHNFSNLTILRTIQEDEGIYHCAIIEWAANFKCSSTFLIVKGDSQKTSDYTVVQQSTASHSVHPGESQTLHCSVFSDSDKKTCSGDPSVFWFRPGSDKSHPDIIYTDVNRPDECEKRSDTQKSCVYHSSKTFNSSDAGTYYCAVATCGQILFGNGTTLVNQGSSMWSVSPVTFLLCIFLALSLIIIAILIYSIKENNCDYGKAAAQQKNCGGQKSEQKDLDTWIYSAVTFTMVKADSAIKEAKAAERERIYTAVKAFGLD
uniref:Ig-like domain-containing protein n=1 Tax=Amphiprion percula TaxID=161767 RepID=A0A3P8RW19_AMPPE